MTGTNSLLSLSYSCPKVVVNYDTTTVKCQTNTTGKDGRLYFTTASSTPNHYQCYIDVYFYFNELCVGRYCISGEYEIYDDSDTQ
jgi:hypothetical protein